jgi:hypothetical protein
LEERHILELVLLHEFAHAQQRDQARYRNSTCQQRRSMETQADLFVAKTLRAALLGERGVAAQATARRTIATLIGLGWQYTSNRALRELFPESVRSDPHALRRAYCEGGLAHPPMEARMLELYRTILGSEYATMFGGDAAVISALQGGTIEMTLVATCLLTGHVKDFGIFDLPYLFDNYKEADAVLDGPIGKRLLDPLPEKGLLGLTCWDHGFRNLTNSRRPIASPDDIKGLKVRVLQLPIQSHRFRRADGGNPDPNVCEPISDAREPVSAFCAGKRFPGGGDGQC